MIRKKGEKRVKHASDIIETANLEDLVFYIDYVDMLLEMVKKRNAKDLGLEEERIILRNRYDELLKIQT